MLLIAIAVALSGLALIGALLFQSEKWVIHQRGGNFKISPGVLLAIDQACRLKPRSRAPLVAVFPETLPMACVAKGAFKPGVVMISQGLLSSLSDEELLSVFKRGIDLLNQRGAARRTFCFALYGKLGFAQKSGWTPLQALLMWMTLPLRGFLVRQTERLNVFAAAPTSSEDRAWLGAVQKVSYFQRIFS